MRQFLICITFIISAASVQAMRVFVDHAVYFEPDGNPYVEVLFSFDYATFTPRYNDSSEFAGAQIVLTLLKDTSVFLIRKGDVYSPAYRKGDYSDFSHVERFAAPPGDYKLRLEITDLFGVAINSEVYEQRINLPEAPNSVKLSTPQLIAAFRPSEDLCNMCKSGYEILPYLKTYVPGDMKTLAFYGEVYGTHILFGEGNPFILRAMLIDHKGTELVQHSQQWRASSSHIVPILRTLDIKDLRDGEYNLRVEVRDKENHVIHSSERRFNRAAIAEKVLSNSNHYASLPAYFLSFKDSATLYEKILYLMPIAQDNDRYTIQNQLEKADLNTLQLFHYNFWHKRNPSDPESSCREYEQRTKEVESAFLYRGKKGWQTDRGRVYLQYGKPNTRIIRPSDPDYWPFEIWHYYETDNNLHNRRFLFYDTALGGDMELLHSDVPAEVKNFAWKEMVRSRPAALNMSDASAVNAAQRSDPFSRDEIENLWYSPH